MIVVHVLDLATERMPDAADAGGQTVVKGEVGGMGWFVVSHL